MERALPCEDGTELYVERYGAAHARTIVLTHGAGANRTSWYYAVRALAAHFQVLVWDMPGLGHSDKPRNGNYSLERHASDLEAVLGLASGRPALLVGHSMGGMVVLTLCRLFPQHLGTRVRGLALVGTTYSRVAGVQARETLAMFRYDAQAVLSSIHVPTLVCTGHLDRLIVPETARSMAEQLPDPHVVRLEPAGHMSLFERHDQLIARLGPFADEALSDSTPMSVRAGSSG